jgi:hypothetical protein
MSGIAPGTLRTRIHPCSAQAAGIRVVATHRRPGAAGPRAGQVPFWRVGVVDQRASDLAAMRGGRQVEVQQGAIGGRDAQSASRLVPDTSVPLQRDLGHRVPHHQQHMPAPSKAIRARTRPAGTRPARAGAAKRPQSHRRQPRLPRRGGGSGHGVRHKLGHHQQNALCDPRHPPLPQDAPHMPTRRARRGPVRAQLQESAQRERAKPPAIR